MSDATANPGLEPFWTVREVRALLRVGRNAVYDLAERGELPHVRIGSRLRFDPVKVRAWLEARTVAGGKVLRFRGGGSPTNG